MTLILHFMVVALQRNKKTKHCIVKVIEAVAMAILKEEVKMDKSVVEEAVVIVVASMASAITVVDGVITQENAGFQ